MNFLAKTCVSFIAIGVVIGVTACSHHQPAPVDDIQYSSNLSNKYYSFASSNPTISQNSTNLNNTTVHKVHPGETLFAIAWKYSLDYHDIAKINKLKNFRIYPGQTLSLKQEAPKSIFEASTLVAAINNDVLNKKTKTTSRLMTSKQSVESNRQRLKQNKSINNTGNNSSSFRNQRTIAPRVVDNKIKNWIWPVNGKILQGFSNKNNQNKGLDIKAKLGSAVRATAPGKVVYSGSGLRGYGQLVIIKHNDSYLSAYAHNNKIHVIENEVVKAGQRIADIGKSGTEKVKLHFEIRYKGKPVNPLNYLPKAG